MFEIDRNMPIPIGEQLKGQIIHHVSTGLLKARDRLPSLRELARALEVSYATIAHVYRELAEDGFVVSQTGKGTYVADLVQLDNLDKPEALRSNLLRLVEVLVGQASLLGFTRDEIAETVSSYLSDCYDGKEPCHIVLVGMARNATDSYAREMEALLTSLNVKVKAVLLGELEADQDRTIAEMRPASVVATVPTSFQQVCDMLEPRGFHVSAIAFRPSAETRRRMASISAGCSVGVVATEPKYLQSLVQQVSAYISSGKGVSYAVRGDERAIKYMLARVDVVIYHSGCEQFLAWLPPAVQAIEYLHSPEPDSVLRLIPVIRGEMDSLESQPPM